MMPPGITEISGCESGKAEWFAPLLACSSGTWARGWFLPCAGLTLPLLMTCVVLLSGQVYTSIFFFS